MKKTILLTATVILLAGCTSTITHYDADGKISKVEEVTNFSRAMDGLNEKSQIVMVDGTFVDFEVSAMAGENCTPGMKTVFANGKTAFVNARDSGNYKGASRVVEKFFAKDLKVSGSGIESK